MVLLRLVLVITLGACYSPELGDCTVACRADSDCATGQSCTAGMCAHEGVACTDDRPVPDAGIPVEQDGATSPPDAEPPPPPPQGILRVKIADKGIVVPAGQTPCDSTVASECMYVIELETPLVLEAHPHVDRFLEKWEEACSGQPGTTCTITPTQWETRVTAKFRKID